MQDDLSFAICHDGSADSLGKRKPKKFKTVPISISVDSLNSPRKNATHPAKPILRSLSKSSVSQQSSSQQVPRSPLSRGLKDAISSKMMQKQTEEASRFLIGSLLRPTAYVENGFVIGARGIEKAPDGLAPPFFAQMGPSVVDSSVFLKNVGSGIKWDSLTEIDLDCAVRFYKIDLCLQLADFIFYSRPRILIR